MRITVNGKHSEVPVGRECEPSVWNRHVGREIGTKSDVRALNGYLDTLQTKIMNAHQLLIGAGECITSERLREWIFIKRQKTDTNSRIPLLPVASAIVETYADHQQCVNKMNKLQGT